MNPVRIATRADEPEIMRLLHLMHGECGMLSLDEDCARETFSLSFDRKGGIIGVIGEPTNIKAMICLLITRFWYTRDNHLEELFNYVRPDARKDGRKSAHAEELITFAKKCAETIGIPLVIGVLTNKQMETKVRLYRRVLGVPAGAFFVANPPPAWRGERVSNENFWLDPFRAQAKVVRAAETLADYLRDRAGKAHVEYNLIQAVDGYKNRVEDKTLPLPAATATAAMVGMM